MATTTRRRGTTGPNASRYTASAVLDAEALRLHEDEGLSLDQIIARPEFTWQTRGAASRAIARAWARGPGAKVEEIRTRLTAVLMGQLDSLVGEFLDARDQGQRDDMIRLSREITRTTDAISRRNGTDAPVKAEITVIEDWDAKMRQLVDKLGEAPTPEQLIES